MERFFTPFSSRVSAFAGGHSAFLLAAVLVILATVGAILIARRQPKRQSLLPDFRTAPSRWWQALSDAERNLAADFRHHFEK